MNGTPDKLDIPADLDRREKPLDETTISRSGPRWAWDVIDELISTAPPNKGLVSATFAINEARPRKQRKKRAPAKSGTPTAA